MPPTDPRTDSEDVMALADRLFAAIEAGDVDAFRACLSDDCVAWSNAAPERRADDLVTVIGWLVSRLADRRYDVTRREAVAGGFLQQHVLRGTAPDGTEIAMPACVIASVDGGRITRIDEYLDPAQVAPLSRRPGI